jgi:hypothetical protein
MENESSDLFNLADRLEKLTNGDSYAKSAGKRAYKTSTRHASEPNQPHVWGLNDPEKYDETYSPLPTVSSASPLGKLFANGASGQHHKPLVERSAKELLPGVYSFEETHLLFLREFSNTLTAEIPVDVDQDGFSSTGIHRDFGSLKCPAGYMQTPMSAKAVDNTILRRDLGLTDGYSPRQKLIADTIWNEIFSQADASSVNVPKHSAGGMRRFTHDVQWKIDYAQYKTVPRRYDRFLSLVEKSDAYGLANEFEILYGMYINKRLQLDVVGKERLANDWKYALTGGKSGQRRPTDKKVVIDGRAYDDFSACRVRVIDAGPWSINCDLQMVASSHMKSLFRRYPSVFHVNTAEQIKTVVDGKHVFCSDVSEFDQSMSSDALACCFNAMRNYYPEGLVLSAERLSQAPYYARPLEIGGTTGSWVHNPMDWSFKLNAGNRSGHAFTSLIAKGNKVIETLFVIDKVYDLGPDVSGWREVLSGRAPIGLINNGDDEIIWSDSKSMMDRFKRFRSDLKTGHYVVTPEVGNVFSGMLLTRKEKDSLIYHPVPRVHTAFEKMYVPERSIGGVLRPFWPIGVTDRFNNLSSSEAGLAALDIHRVLFKKMMEPKYGPFTALLRQGYSAMPHVRSDLSAIDRSVLVDNDKLHYLYADDEVTASTQALITANIPKEYVRGFLKRYYSGNLT